MNDELFFFSLPVFWYIQFGEILFTYKITIDYYCMHKKVSKIQGGSYVTKKRCFRPQRYE